MRQREDLVREYFSAWLNADPQPLDRIFDPDIVYRESGGAEHRGFGQVRRWFLDWNMRGRVMRWDVLSFLHQGDSSAVEWHFECVYYDGLDGNVFDGVSLITFGDAGRIVLVKEFGSRLPYHAAADRKTPAAHGK